MPANANPTCPSRVLIVRAGALGDTLMITPLIRRLHEEQPGREIHVLCSPPGAALLRSNPYISRVYSLRNRNVPYLLSTEKQRLVKELRSNRYGLAILLESAPRYRKVLERARIPEIRGFAEFPFNPAEHSVINNLRAGGFETEEAAAFNLELNVTDAARQQAAHWLGSLPKPRIGLHPGYGPVSKKKDQTERLRGWKISNFREVADELAARGASLVITGSREDRAVCEEIARGLPPETACVLAGETSVEQLGAVIACLDLFISVDSGPAHMATALGTPLVVLWGPGILAQTGPISASTAIHVLNAKVPCAPCYGTVRMKQCRRNICMEQIQPREVIAAAWSLLGTDQLAGAPAAASRASDPRVLDSQASK